MTIYKRIGSFLLSLLLVFSMFSSTFAIQTFAATSPALSAESKTVNAGEQFTVAVSLANATTVYGGNFTLQYDSSLLTADSYEFSSIVSGHTKNCNLNYQSAGNLIRVTFSGASAVTSSGTLITFTFTVKENVSGSAALQFNAYKMYDENGSAITSTANGSTITIATEPVVSPTLSITNKTITEGSTVNVPIVISDSEAVYGGNFTLQYDSDLLTANSYTFGSIVSDHTKNCNLNYQSAGNLIRVTFSGADAVNSDGTLVTFTFTAKASGTATLQFNAYKMYDENGTSISTVISNGTVEVEPKPTRELVSIEISSNPTKTSYEIDESLDTSGLKLKLTYSDNSTETITSGFSVSGFSSTTAGTKTVTVTYQGYTDTFTVTVNDPSISIVAEGECKYNLYWILDSNGKLTIKGTGRMYDYDYRDYPWWQYKNKIKTIEILDGVTSVGKLAFQNCDNLTSVEFPSTMTSIGGQSFESCNSLKSVTILGNDAIIGGHAFNNCTALESLVLSEGVVEIGSQAFYDCPSLTTLIIPKSVTKISTNAFIGCSGLETIVVEDGNSVYHSAGNCLIYTSAGWMELGCKNSVIPNDGSVVSVSGFEDCIGLTSITIPEGVKSIGSFSGCINLTSITIPRSVTTIGQYSFSGCDNLTIYGYPNTNASAYAHNNDIPFVNLIEGVEIVNVPTKTIYYINDSLNTSGLKLQLNCADGTTETITSGFSISGFSSTSAGTKTVTVSYEGFTDTFAVTVRTPSITLSSNSKSMLVGDMIEITATTTPSGQTVTWSSSNTDVAIVLDGTVMAKKSGAATITANFTYNGITYSKTCSLTVENPVVLQSISIINEPTNTVYYFNSNLDTSGMKVQLNYSDGSTSIITTGFTTTGFNTILAGTQTITVTYEGLSDTFEITMIEPTIVLSSSSKVMSIGDSSIITAITTPSGQTVNWTSSNTSVATVSGGMITAKSSGSTTITAKFTYNGITYSKTCTVTVEDVPVPPTPVSLTVSTKPTKTTYEIGESLNTSGLKLKLTYSDGSTETITSGFTTSGFSSTTAGTKTVTVKYGSLTTTFTVTVNPAPVPDDLAQLVMSSSETMAGKEITLTLALKNNPGIAGMTVSFRYDESVLTLKDSKNGGLFSGFTAAKNFAWDESENVTDDGVLATFTFTIAENAPAGEYGIEVIVRSCTNEDLDDVELLTTNGIVSVIDFVYGDSNGDNKIDIKDVVLLRKYITNFDYDTNTSSVNVELGADANGDDKIDIKDVVILRKYITNYDYDTESSTVILGPQ